MKTWFHAGVPWMKTPIAHRGLFGGEIPENSLGAFKNARDKGFGIELDVQLSKDNQVVVFHDDTLDRMTGHPGFLRDFPLSELKALSLEKTHEKIPLLEEVLQEIQGQVPIHVEIKQMGAPGLLEEKCAQLLKDYRGPFAILSFNIPSLVWFQENYPNWVRVLNIDTYTWPQLLRELWQAKPDFLNFNIESLRSWVPQILGVFYGVGAYTIRDAKTYQRWDQSLNHVIFENINTLKSGW